MIRAIRDVFGLSEGELIVPEFARYEAALGAALKASGSFTLRQLNDSLDRTLTTHHMVGTLPKLELRPGTSLAEPNATKIIPESGCALGIDIGSTSTDLVLVGADGELVDFNICAPQVTRKELSAKALQVFASGLVISGSPQSV